MSLNKKVKKALENSLVLKNLGYEKQTDFFYMKVFGESYLGIDIQFYGDKYTFNIGLQPVGLKPVWSYASWVSDEIDDCAAMSLYGRLAEAATGEDEWFDNLNKIDQQLILANQYLIKVAHGYQKALKDLNLDDFEREDYSETLYIDSKLFNLCSDPIFAIYLLLYFEPDKYNLYKDKVETAILDKPGKLHSFFLEAFVNLIV